jgi:autoinducer 2-degrading protein
VHAAEEMGSPVVTVSAHLTVELDRTDELPDDIHTTALAPLHGEAGCLRIHVHRSAERPHQFVPDETSTDEDTLTTGHRQAPHRAAWRQVAERSVVSGGHVNTFDTAAYPLDIPERPEHLT